MNCQISKVQIFDKQRSVQYFVGYLCRVNWHVERVDFVAGRLGLSGRGCGCGGCRFGCLLRCGGEAFLGAAHNAALHVHVLLDQLGAAAGGVWGDLPRYGLNAARPMHLLDLGARIVVAVAHLLFDFFDFFLEQVLGRQCFLHGHRGRVRMRCRVQFA